MFQQILLATDGSEHSLRATERAIELARHLPSAQVEVVYVIDAAKTRHEVLQSHSDDDLLADLRSSRLYETETKIKAAGLSYSIKVLHGEPGPSIVHHANQKEADLVIIGSRGRNALQEMVLGSVSHKVAKRANCPVMIVK
ncbi:universal stress protein [Tumebacillus avium]|uniref:Universal stress protein n=1 Tax=Tumebacillus avium TaxID=1903704 RepID=A0A1Y0IIG8_9BACL|nr:universal stress protein [Tumebacillus avium]ARU60258.1 universal stress protein [Tumebacillus avium]